MSIDKKEPSQSTPNNLQEIPERNRIKYNLRRIIDFTTKLADAYKRKVEILKPAYDKLLEQKDLKFDDLWEVRDQTDRSLREDKSEGEPSEEMSSSQLMTEIYDQFPEPEKSKWLALIKFLIHDANNAAAENLILWHARSNQGTRRMVKKDETDYHKITSEDRTFYKGVIEKFPALSNQLLYAYQFTKGFAQLELGQEPEDVEEVDLKTLIETIALATQLRFGENDYSITTSENRHPESSEIIVDIDQCNLTTSTSMLWSIIYNLVKNAAKELDYTHEEFEAGEYALYRRLLDGSTPQNPRKIHIKCESLPRQNVTLIHVVDSGEGLKDDEIMQSMKGLIEAGLLEGTKLGKSVKKILEQWQKNPFALRNLKKGDVYDFAGLARVSGFSTRQRTRKESSGMGLWGANYLADKLGGGIISTNTMEGGALFTVIIPNEYFGQDASGRRNVRSVTGQIRKGLEKGMVNVNLPKAA